MRLALLPILLFALASLTGQRTRLLDEPSGEILVGGGAEESFSDFTASPDGRRVALVGHAGRSPNGLKDDILFVLADAKTLEPQRTVNLGRSGFDTGHAIAARPGGGYLVAGVSETIREQTAVRERYHGGRDGWLLWLNDEGRTQAELLVGGVGDDALTFLDYRGGGDWLAAGHRGGEAWVITLRGGAQPEVLEQYRFSAPNHKTGAIVAAAVNDRGEVALAGYTGEERGASPWVVGVSPEGRELFNRVYLPGDFGRALSIEALPGDAGWAVAGEAGGVTGRGDALVLTLDRGGQPTGQAQFGGRDKDVFEDLSLTPEGDLLLLGES